ncbi:sugar transporter stl1 [Trichoderma arundinaceum]|uniref:Sugar transporter stl1 n=1 Tax=Trichoderma arundinaceum TaxID=490622 RepID=A0A395P1D7_TRIAR|nr:sugar transporter stl1 [Trichoderma arundinaceum]
MVAPTALETIGYKYYIVFCVVCATIPPVVCFFFPETMGQNLEDIERIFQESKSIQQTVALAPARATAEAIENIDDIEQ